jgi:hypothetical protein
MKYAPKTNIKTIGYLCPSTCKIYANQSAVKTQETIAEKKLYASKLEKLQSKFRKI